MDKSDIVQVKMPCQAAETTPVVPSRAVQLKVGKNKCKHLITDRIEI